MPIKTYNRQTRGPRTRTLNLSGITQYHCVVRRYVNFQNTNFVIAILEGILKTRKSSNQWYNVSTGSVYSDQGLRNSGIGFPLSKKFSYSRLPVSLRKNCECRKTGDDRKSFMIEAAVPATPTTSTSHQTIKKS